MSSILASVLKFRNSELEVFFISKSLLILYVLFKVLPERIELTIMFSDAISISAIKILLIRLELISNSISLSFLNILIEESSKFNCLDVPSTLEFILREFKFK